MLLLKKNTGNLHGDWDIDLVFSESNDENSIKPCFFLPPSFQSIEKDVCIISLKMGSLVFILVNADKDTDINFFVLFSLLGS